MSTLPAAGSYWRHKKSGGVYEVVSCCLIEATLELGVIYESESGFYRDGVFWKRWCRPAAEFMDGRFEPAADASPTPMRPTDE